MRFGLISTLLLAIAFAVGDAEITEDTNLEFLIQTFVLPALSKGGEIKLQKNSWRYLFPNGIENITKGLIQLNGSEIHYGKVTPKRLYVGSEKNNAANTTTVLLQLGLYLKEFVLKIGYDLDMALISLIPLYGRGELNLAAKAIRLNFTICVVNGNQGLHLQSFGLEELSFKPDMTNLVGFLNNPEADQIFTKILNVGEEAFCLFYNLEKPCIICILQETIKYILNHILNNKVPFVLNCACLKKKQLGLEYDLKSNLEGLVSTMMDGTMEDKIRYIFNDEMCRMWNDIYLRTHRLVENKGLLRQLQ